MFIAAMRRYSIVPRVTGQMVPTSAFEVESDDEYAEVIVVEGPRENQMLKKLQAVGVFARSCWDKLCFSTAERKEFNLLTKINSLFIISHVMACAYIAAFQVHTLLLHLFSLFYF